ncbi:uncharacterized protein LOC130801127 [Amaranthus tricolor]|uniref:uncharacterized protein LOC130801127 n=1 Tax=Amaranthus tricolor TaxID=29722 RepID=UPI00258B8E1B|nr:uncharacterized protein LOC130801127 [Amaranthus tricolor]
MAGSSEQRENNNTAINLNNKRIGRQAPNKLNLMRRSSSPSNLNSKGLNIQWQSKWKFHSQLLSFALSKLQYDENNDSFQFKPHTNIVHIDGKHFYLTPESQTYYLASGDVKPYCEYRDMAFYYSRACQKELKNRKRGELETQPIQSMTKEHMRLMLITNVLPIIRGKWPHGMSKHIFIQQDNAKPHIAHNDKEFMEEAMKNDFLYNLSIQALQYQKAAYNVPQLLSAVNNAFDNLSAQCLRVVFITLQACMIETMKRQGGIDYHIPHMN